MSHLVKNLVLNYCFDLVLESVTCYKKIKVNAHIFYILEFYQPTPGVYFERWTSSSYYGISNFNSIPNYPDCPKHASNSDKFSHSNVHNGYKQYGRFRASFVSTQTGVHKFFAILNDKAQIYIELNPTGMRKIFDVGSATDDDWSHR